MDLSREELEGGGVLEVGEGLLEGGEAALDFRRARISPGSGKQTAGKLRVEAQMATAGRTMKEGELQEMDGALGKRRSKIRATGA